jgi:hypothetical protein
LSEDSLLGNCKYEGSDRLLGFELALGNLTNSENNKRSAQGCIETQVTSVVNDFCDSATDLAPDWHLALEVKIFCVIQLVEANSDGGVVTDRDEAASFANVSDVTNEEIAL